MTDSLKKKELEIQRSRILLDFTQTRTRLSKMFVLIQIRSVGAGQVETGFCPTYLR